MRPAPHSVVAMPSEPAGAERIALLVLLLGAAGEIGAGAAALAAPSLLGVLLDAPLDTTGLLAARMLGCAILALGATWWFARRGPGGLARCATGFLIYNLGIGALFLVQAMSATGSTSLPWAVGVVHALIGVGFGGALVAARPSFNRDR